MPNEDPFVPLLAAARTGSSWAWERLYRELSPRVLGYLRARGASDPEDLLGEIFLQVVRDLARFSGDEPAFRAWIFTIARNRMLDQARSNARRNALAPRSPLPDDLPAGDVEHEALAELRADEIRTLLGSLSDDQRDVLLLRIIGGLTIDEIAASIAKRPDAVKALQRRGLNQLRRRIGTDPYPSTAFDRF